MGFLFLGIALFTVVYLAPAWPDAIDPMGKHFPLSTQAKGAIAVFLLGTLSAGLSSIFPILMIFPLLVADYKTGKLDISSKQFRVLSAIVCLIGLTVPLIGGNPIEIQILTQVFLVFVLPLVVLGIGILVKKLAVARFARTLGSLLENGVSMLIA